MLYIDTPTRADITTLNAQRADACVSIYLPTTPLTQDVEMEAPLRRGRQPAQRASIGQAKEYQAFGHELIAGYPGRRDQQSGRGAARATNRHVAGPVCVDPGRIHRSGGGDHLGAQCVAVFRRMVGRRGLR